MKFNFKNIFIGIASLVMVAVLIWLIVLCIKIAVSPNNKKLAQITSYTTVTMSKTSKVKEFDVYSDFYHSTLNAVVHMKKSNLSELTDQFYMNYWRKCDESATIPDCSLWNNIDESDNLGFYKRSIPLDGSGIHYNIVYILIKPHQTKYNECVVYIWHNSYADNTV